MAPLDLTLHAPRPCREDVDGVPFLARAIDKARADLPGGNLGNYLILAAIPTLSSIFYRRLGIDHDDFKAAVASASTDAEVAAWVRERTTDADVEQLRATLYGLRLNTIPEPSRSGVMALYPAAKDAAPDTLLIDVIAADDAVLFAKA